MAEESKTFDVMVDGEKKGVAYDTNPVCIETDDQCRKCLTDLKDKLDLTEEESHLLDLCLKVIDAKDDDIMEFGLGEIVQLAELAEKHFSEAHNITACSLYLFNSIEFEGEVPENIFLNMYDSHKKLGDIYDNALNNNAEDLSSDSDED